MLLSALLSACSADFPALGKSITFTQLPPALQPACRVHHMPAANQVTRKRQPRAASLRACHVRRVTSDGAERHSPEGRLGYLERE